MLLEEFIKPLGVSQSDLAARLGISPRILTEIVQKKREVTAGVALRLEKVLGVSAMFWLVLQRNWDLWYARNTFDANVLQGEPRLRKRVF